MPPPLLTLQDISLQIGSQPLLEHAELAVGAGDRVCLVGRNGSGKSTLLRIAAGLMAADAGRRFVQPGDDYTLSAAGTRSGGLSQHARDYVEAGSARTPRKTGIAALYLLRRLGLTGDEEAGRRCRAARPAGRRWRRSWRRSPTSCCWTSRPTIWICPASSGWKMNCPGCAPASSLISHDRRLLQEIMPRPPSGWTVG